MKGEREREIKTGSGGHLLLVACRWSAIKCLPSHPLAPVLYVAKQRRLRRRRQILVSSRSCSHPKPLLLPHLWLAPADFLDQSAKRAFARLVCATLTRHLLLDRYVSLARSLARLRFEWSRCVLVINSSRASKLWLARPVVSCAHAHSHSNKWPVGRPAALI